MKNLKELSIMSKVYLTIVVVGIGWSAVGGTQGLSGKAPQKTVQSESSYKVDAISHCSIAVEDQVVSEGYGYDRIALSNSFMATNETRSNTRVAFDFNVVASNGKKKKLRASCKMNKLTVTAINFN
ncbi:hypothetical protein VP424E501_P0147 [Vibrio phage 424E50-1]|nr:hypothetical protein VP424E501_P0147 [Vibrio phage 424E50-1]